MKTINAYMKIALPLLAVAILTATSGRADTYSWTNLQSDIAGVAQHTDPNVVNPWGMAASPTGIIWVSDNGTGVSTLYHQDGTALSLIITTTWGLTTPYIKAQRSASPMVTIFCLCRISIAATLKPTTRIFIR